MATKITPAQLAQLDQCATAAEHNVDKLIAAYRLAVLVTDETPEMTLAMMGAGMSEGFERDAEKGMQPHYAVIATMLAAVARLAAKEDK